MEHLGHMMNIFEHYPYLSILVVLLLEVFPLELIFSFAGFLIYKDDLNYYMMVFASTIGATFGSLIIYIFGHFGGRPFILKFGKYLFIKEERLNKVDYFFQKYGSFVAFIGRFFAGIRTATPIVCGLSKMNIWIYLLFAFLGTLPISGIYIYLGEKLGRNWNKAEMIAGKYAIFFGIVLFVVLALYFLSSKKFKRNQH